jgi:chromosome partition protein MukE
MSEPFSNLGDVVADESFPAVDLALRRGRHIHKGNERWYAFVSDAQALLEELYGRYGYELLHRTDGYYFLLPGNDSLGKRQLGVPEMIVGQGLALAYLDPRTLEKGAIISREELINQLAATMGTDTLLRALNPKRKRQDESVAQRTARQKVAEALRRLAQLGFVELLDDDQLRLAPSLLRFAEPVRGLDAPSEALRKLLERGEVGLVGDDADPSADGESAEAEGEAEAELDPETEAAALADQEAEAAAAASVQAAVAEAEEARAEVLRHDRSIDSLAEELWSEDPLSSSETESEEESE